MHNMVWEGDKGAEHTSDFCTRSLPALQKRNNHDNGDMDLTRLTGLNNIIDYLDTIMLENSQSLSPGQDAGVH